MEDSNGPLSDATVKVRSFESLFFPKNKKRCPHVALTRFFVKTKQGCIMRCANCGKYVPKRCESCAVGEPVFDVATNHGMFVLPCDAIELREKGLVR